MSIKPIDFQIAVPKTSEISKIQNEDNQKYYTNQQHVSSFVQEQANHAMKRVNATDKSYEGKIRDKNKEESKKHSSQKENRKERKEEQENDKDKKQNVSKPSKGNIIDIHI
ncbi:MAG: hypothetical protein PWP27_123 [Clostridiales bacterium]|nr:hypothetical protein [Clostridiales bacterium]MDK2932313.1 hypothetical protein [Clostridiales bacterium]